jgi:hypothetical protein
MKILWNFNKEVRITRSSNSMLSTGQCKDLANDNTYNNEYQKYLRTKYASFYKFEQLNAL